MKHILGFESQKRGLRMHQFIKEGRGFGKALHIRESKIRQFLGVVSILE